MPTYSRLLAFCLQIPCPPPAPSSLLSTSPKSRRRAPERERSKGGREKSPFSLSMLPPSLVSILLSVRRRRPPASIRVSEPVIAEYVCTY